MTLQVKTGSNHTHVVKIESIKLDRIHPEKGKKLSGGDLCLELKLCLTSD